MITSWPGPDPAIHVYRLPSRVDHRVKPTGVRLRYLDRLHGVDSTSVQAFSDDLDTE